jgi:hypothetical protein
MTLAKEMRPAGDKGLRRARQRLIPMELFEKWSNAEDAAGTGARAERPVLLAWTDPSSGEELWVEMWGGGSFVSELLGLGFAVRADSLAPPAPERRVVIRHLSA